MTAPPPEHSPDCDQPLIELWRSAAEFARSEVFPMVLEWDRRARLPREVWRVLGERGYLGLTLPKAFGGSDLTARHLAVAMDAFAYGSGDLGIVNSWGVHTAMVGMAIAGFGTPEQKQRYLPGIASGATVAAFALTEPEAGSDASAIASRAVPDGQDYLLTGEKAFVTNASEANLFVVLAKVERPDDAPTTAFLVEPDHGVHVGPQREKVCIRTSPLADLTLIQCRVPGAQRLGAEGAAFDTVVKSALEWDRAVVWAGRLGRLRAILEDSVSYARSRSQFGKAIGRHQAIAFTLADMKVRLEAAEHLLDRALRDLDAGRPAGISSSIARLFLGEAVMDASSDAVQIFGGNGVYPEHHVERYCRDARLDGIGGGTSEIQRLIISRDLLREEPAGTAGWMSRWALPTEVVRP